jgi:hypothetical protein
MCIHVTDTKYGPPEYVKEAANYKNLVDITHLSSNRISHWVHSHFMTLLKKGAFWQARRVQRRFVGMCIKNDAQLRETRMSPLV